MGPKRDDQDRRRPVGLWRKFALGAAGALAVVGVATVAGAIDPNADFIYPNANIGASCSDSDISDGGWNACQTDNSSLSICVEASVSPKMSTAIDATRTGSYDVTDLGTVSVEACDYTGSSETDIVFRELSSLPSGAIGFVFCDDAVSSTRCDQHYAQFDAEDVAVSGFNNVDARKLACHEAGHSVGLLHAGLADPPTAADDSDIACMKQGYSNVDALLGAFNRGQIDGEY